MVIQIKNCYQEGLGHKGITDKCKITVHAISYVISSWNYQFYFREKSTLFQILTRAIDKLNDLHAITWSTFKLITGNFMKYVK